MICNTLVERSSINNHHHSILEDLCFRIIWKGMGDSQVQDQEKQLDWQKV